ncbi:hypothetical protein HHK36_028109 [Tetracentron sinense]|uniref:Uncharacterized protein n=1 Tax=Tetracentron sinense TaxID=13715 RepID=A0A835D260_TETSI|nr:hypothetical protein HHK36_028109 [Tetracentron sinense]
MGYARKLNLSYLFIYRAFVVSLTVHRHRWSLFWNHISSLVSDDLREPQATKGVAELCSKNIWLQDPQAMIAELQAAIWDENPCCLFLGRNGFGNPGCNVEVPAWNHFQLKMTDRGASWVSLFASV